ncbi:hypothetical protein LJR015_004321 [Peribacillus frigoritolerans]|uniref:hypothetical protein n=1 Tax=Peribacillus frigoritolerans TaxID=450367 RepID=UPI003ECF26DE
MDILSENLKYASPELTINYEDINNQVRGNGNEKFKPYWLDPRISICKEILQEYTSFSKKLGYYSNFIQDRLNAPLLVSQLYHLLYECGCFDLAETLLYDLSLIELTIPAEKGFTERVLKIQKNSDYRFGWGLLNDKTVNKQNEQLYAEAFQLFFEITEQISYFNDTRAEYWKEQLEKRQVNLSYEYKKRELSELSENKFLYSFFIYYDICNKKYINETKNNNTG